MWAGDGERAVANVNEARRAAESGGVLSPLMSLRIAMDAAEALRIADRGVEANTAFAAAYDQLVALGRQDTERAGTLLNNWGLLLGSLGRPRDSERMLRRSIDVSLAGGSDARVEPISWANLARPLYDLGHYAEAVTLAERAMRMARERGDSVVADQAQLMTARASILAGQFARAQALLDDVDARFRAMFPPTHAAFNALAMDRVRLALERGDVPAATRLADDTVRLMESDPTHRPSLPLALRHRAMVHLRAGRFAEALGDGERLLPIVRANVPEGARSSSLGIAYLTLGEALAGLGRNAEAKTALTEALRHLDEAAGPTHPGTVQARTLLGRL
jgi:tetratricopeptide (TPR) repeat protein